MIHRQTQYGSFDQIYWVYYYGVPINTNGHHQVYAYMRTRMTMGVIARSMTETLQREFRPFLSV